MHKRRILVIISSIVLVLVAGIGGLVVARYIDTSNNPPGATTSNNIPSTQTALSCVDALPLNTKIGQKIMAAGYSNLLASSQPVFMQNGIGGVILMDEASKESLTAFKQGFVIAPTIAVDQEGGTVQRYKSEGVVSGATEIAANVSDTEAYQQYLTDATFLKSVGIDVNFAPVVDVISKNPSPLPGRMYSSNPAIVTEYATQAIKASQKAGVAPVVKHFPGLGSASGNTDDESATTDSWNRLQTRDVLPYRSLAQFKVDAMVSNAIIPDLTDGQPAIWSPAAVAALRGIGYQDAVIYTDSLTAKAIPGTIEDAAIKAWQADVDVALIVQKREDTAGLMTSFQAILTRATAAVENNELSEQKLSASVLRILQRKGINPCSI